MKSLASSFFVHGRIETTEAKAKSLRPLVEKLITRAKSPSLANRRYLSGIFIPAVVKKIFEIADREKARPGGYTRVTKLGARRSDSARMAIFELLFDIRT